MMKKFSSHHNTGLPACENHCSLQINTNQHNSRTTHPSHLYTTQRRTQNTISTHPNMSRYYQEDEDYPIPPGYAWARPQTTGSYYQTDYPDSHSRGRRRSSSVRAALEHELYGSSQPRRSASTREHRSESRHGSSRHRSPSVSYVGSRTREPASESTHGTHRRRSSGVTYLGSSTREPRSESTYGTQRRPSFLQSLFASSQPIRRPSLEARMVPGISGAPRTSSSARAIHQRERRANDPEWRARVQGQEAASRLRHRERRNEADRARRLANPEWAERRREQQRQSRWNRDPASRD